MTEKKRQLRIAIKLIIIIIFSLLYALGGMAGFPKYLRRFVAPGVLCLSMFIFTKDWKCLIQLPFMFASLSLGYGASSLWGKIIRRLIFGSANGISSSIRNILKKSWLLVGTQVILLAGLYIVFGVFNPLSARAEETLLGLSIALIPLLSAEK